MRGIQKVRRPTQTDIINFIDIIIGHFGDAPHANLLACHGKTKPNTTKAHIHQLKEMYYNTRTLPL